MKLLDQETVDKQATRTVTPDGMIVLRIKTNAPKPIPPQGRGWHKELSHTSIYEVKK